MKKIKFKSNYDLSLINKALSQISVVDVKNNTFAGNAILSLLDDVKYSIEKKIIENRSQKKCSLSLTIAQCYACLSVQHLIHTNDNPYDNVVFVEFISSIHQSIV